MGKKISCMEHIMGVNVNCLSLLVGFYNLQVQYLPCCHSQWQVQASSGCNGGILTSETIKMEVSVLTAWKVLCHIFCKVSQFIYPVKDRSKISPLPPTFRKSALQAPTSPQPGCRRALSALQGQGTLACHRTYWYGHQIPYLPYISRSLLSSNNLPNLAVNYLTLNPWKSEQEGN